MYKLTVITPTQVFFDEQVSSLTAFGGNGYLQVLTNHCSLLSTLQPGKLSITKENGEKLVYAVSGGFLEVSQNVATILADAMELPKEIDIGRAESAAKRAQDRLRETDGHIDIARAKAALKRADNRIKLFNELDSSRPVRIRL